MAFFAFARELRKILYAATRPRFSERKVELAGGFLSEEAATKLLWLVLRNVQER